MEYKYKNSLLKSSLLDSDNFFHKVPLPSRKVSLGQQVKTNPFSILKSKTLSVGFSDTFSSLSSRRSSRLKNPLIIEGEFLSTKTPHKLTHEEFSKFNFNKKLRLGTGAYSEVYLCKGSDKNYAIKQMSKSLIVKKVGTLKYIYKEIELHTKLNHPNIIQLYSYFEDETDFYLVMEYASNGNLFNLIKNDKYLSEKNAFYYFYQIANAVYFLHESGLVHRDIKPENILLTEDNKIKLCDFGLCYENSISNRNSFCGTLDYMAPEILQGNSYNKSVDVWSLGVVLYEMIFGELPFKNGNRIVSFDTKNTLIKISNETKELIRQMLISNPKRRICIKDIFDSSALKKYESSFSKNEPEEVPKPKNQIVSNNMNPKERASALINAFCDEKENLTINSQRRESKLRSKLASLKINFGKPLSERNITKKELMAAIQIMEDSNRLLTDQSSCAEKNQEMAPGKGTSNFLSCFGCGEARSTTIQVV